jgi:septum formation inhibitor-activating ATPase MinD
MQAEGKNVCIIDANFQQADTGKYLNVYNPNITSVVRDPSGVSRERIGQFLIHRPDLGISALLGPATPMDANPVYINSKLYNQVIEPLKEVYDYIIIDTPVAEKYHDILSSFALPQADFIVVPVTPNWAALMNADSWLNAVCTPRHSGGDGVDERKVGIVLNRAKVTVDCSEEDVRQELSRWNFIGLIPENDAWQRCDNNGELIATQRFTDINDAFSRILYAATKERALLNDVYIPTDTKKKQSIIKKLLGRKD